ncbi:MAG: hypothetical protein ACXACG_12305 [Candidatus Thorarchaeota archaeon]
MKRKVGALSIVVITLILTLVYILPFSSRQTTLEGIPVLESVFAELVESEPDPVVFPQYPVVETSTSITMKFDYTGFEKVNESVALTASIEFISQIWYLAEFNLLIDTGWTILDDETWRFRFIDGSVDVHTYVSVNAISGKVSHFTSVWPVYESPFLPNISESQFANSSELEQLAVDFFNLFNYSLSTHARYIGPNLRYDYALNHDVFVISFSNVVNGILIDGGVHLYLDVEANAILRFSYSWVHVDAIPKESIISREQARQYARSYLKETANISVFEIDSVTLLFHKTWSSLGHIYRLGWIVPIDSEYIVMVKVDAKSGTVYDVGYKII